ncbi:MAG: 16S rRNA (cytidine(1402)-2'-O)-methyltransferase [Bauldia sp.]|nr:16S rRNA (cytidine(1402)-2'-O)-methyltransferase [Bauldia sp.]
MPHPPAGKRSFAIDGHAHAAPPLAPGLYIVATPIGHLGDVTLRALATLAAADLVACEDTRITARLTQRYAIAAPLLAYHEHNAARQRPKLLAALADGKAVALVSDAGTPLISDPGYRLVAEAVAAGHAVIPVPGASAVLAALAGAGLPTDTFLFAGFLPPRETARRKRLAALAAIPATLAFYEAPQRLGAALADMAAVLGMERRAVVARELTKTFEEFRRAPLAALAAHYADAAVKGEIVILVAPPAPAAAPDDAAIDAMLRAALREHGVAEAATLVAGRSGLPRRQLYSRILELQRDADDDA